MNTKMPSYHGVWKSRDDQRGGAAGPVTCVALGLFFLLVAALASAAEPYLVLGGGFTQYDSYAADPAHDQARFCDRGFLCDPRTGSAAWQLGLGLKFDEPKWHLKWAAELSFADFGITRLASEFPPDSEYNVATHSCVGNCGPDNLYKFRGDWHARGPVFAVLPSYAFGQVNIYGKLGMAVQFIKGHAWFKAPGSDEWIDCTDDCKANAIRYGPVIGAGISYEGFRLIKPYLEFNRVQTFGGGFPGSTSWQSFIAGFRIPLR